MKVLKEVLLIAAVLFSANYASAQTEDSNSGEVVVLNKEHFLQKVYNYEKNSNKWLYEGSVPCIIDFYADWCGPCKMVAPILKELAMEYKGKIIVYKINVDENRELATLFGVRSIPTFLFVPAKGDPQSAKGSLPRESFVSAIDNFLLKPEQK
ncbi:MAG: thioredoxin [Tannerella sp.]|nr:thioredoxin [Tannerella sp.]